MFLSAIQRYCLFTKAFCVAASIYCCAMRLTQSTHSNKYLDIFIFSLHLSRIPLFSYTHLWRHIICRNRMCFREAQPEQLSNHWNNTKLRQEKGRLRLYHSTTATRGTWNFSARLYRCRGPPSLFHHLQMPGLV